MEGKKASSVPTHSSALQRLARRRRRQGQLALLIVLAVAGLFLSVHWFDHKKPATKPGVDTPWQACVSKEGRFTVRLPNTVSEEKRNFSFQGQPIPMVVYEAPAGDVMYIAGFADYPSHSVAVFSPDEFLSATRANYETFPGGHIAEEHPVKYRGFSGCERRLEAGTPARPQRAILRFYLIGERIYHIGAAGPVGFDQLVTDALKVFESFEVTGPMPSTKPY